MNRRDMLAALAAGAAAAALPEAGGAMPAADPPAAGGQEPAAAGCGAAAPGWIPNVVVTTHENRRALFYHDLVRGRTAMIHFMSIAGEAANPVTANLAAVQRLLGERMGREVFLYSITSDPEHDTPRLLADFAARHGAGPGWLFLTGEPEAIRHLRERLFAHDGHHAAAGEAPAADCALGLVRYGNAAVGLWGAAPARSDPQALAARLAWVRPAAGPATGAPRRRGPAPLLAALALAAGLALAAPGGSPVAAAAPPAGPAGMPAPKAAPLPGVPSVTAPAGSAAAPPAPAAATPAGGPPAPAPPPAAAVACGPAGNPYRHPHPQPFPCSSHETPAGGTTTIVTGESIFPPSFPFTDPPGTNFLPTVYTNLFDGAGNEVPNTLPSTPGIAYNLLDGDPVVSAIDPTSPRDDLARVFDTMARYAAEGHGPSPAVTKQLVLRAIHQGIDILEGNPVADRVYSGLPLLHYDGPDKLRKVQPVRDGDGKVAGGELHVHQVWYDSHVESDTSMVDLGAVQDVPWTIVYTIDVLNRGEDDFSPYVVYQDPPMVNGVPVPWAAMDATFFPMQDGTRTVFRVKMAPGKYYNLIYTWGWRMHPPRAQAMENVAKVVAGKNLIDWESGVFGPSPRASAAAKLAAIAQLGDLAPSKRMWNALRAARSAAERDDLAQLRSLTRDGREAFDDWQDRTHLPHGVTVDKSTDMTLFYADNTLYGEFSNGALRVFPQWQTRGTRYTVTLYNADYFVHRYMMIDFGGARGWENQFKSSVKDAGSGCWFTFGRSYYWPVFDRPVEVPAASPHSPGQLGTARVDLTFNWDPERRLRFYQFDPTHHDVAIFSVH